MLLGALEQPEPLKSRFEGEGKSGAVGESDGWWPQTSPPHLDLSGRGPRAEPARAAAVLPQRRGACAVHEHTDPNTLWVPQSLDSAPQTILTLVPR